MSGKQKQRPSLSSAHHHGYSSLHYQPIGPTRTMPLAPPAANDDKKPKRSSDYLRNYWPSWLSPRVARRPTGNQASLRNQRCESILSNGGGGGGDDDYTRGGAGLSITTTAATARRTRRSSFDETQVDYNARGAAAAAAFIDASKGKAKETLSFQQHQSPSIDSFGVLVATASGNGGAQNHYHNLQQQQQPYRKQKQQSGSGSLLTTFLLYFDALLPEYFNYFAHAADIECNNGASNAVGVLERGARTVQLHAMMTSSSLSTKRSNTFSYTTATAAATSSSYSSAPSSPNNHVAVHDTSSSLLSTNSDGEENRKSSNDDANNTDQGSHNLRHHWLTISPRTREKLQRVAGQVSPRHMNSMKYNSTLQAEWERFTSPFLMLAGAEVLYGSMEHVLDPEMEEKISNGESLVAVGKGDGRSSSFVNKFDNINKQEDTANIVNSSTPSPTESRNKRGSRRLTAMYRHVREDFIIVGEYLCDPFLGSHTSIGGGGGVSISNAESTTFEFTPQSSKSQPSTPESNTGALGQDETEVERQIAARSLRHTLDALIAFIDARCVLVKIHAELCCYCWFDSTPANAVEVGSGGNKKWTTLAEECRSMRVKMSFWTAREDSMVQRALLKLETEMKALELALLSVYHMMECDFFNCVLNVRKLHVLLGQCAQSSLQLKWMKVSLQRILSMMGILFYNNHTSDSPLLSRSSSFLPPKTEDPGQLDKILSEFISTNENGSPLAVIVVRRTVHNDLDEADKLPTGATQHGGSISMSWTPIYTKTTLDKRVDVANSQTRNNPLVQMIRGIGGSNEDKTNPTLTHSPRSENEERCWSFGNWPQIEKFLITNFGVDSRACSFCFSPSNCSLAPSVTNNQSNTTSMCHIVRITDTISVMAVQGVSQLTKQRQVSSLKESLANVAMQISPENIFSVSSVLQAKATISTSTSNKNANERVENAKNQRVSEKSALWSETGWSDLQRKKVLHSLGLTSKHSPVVSAPLKSPYVRRQMSRMRQRKKKEAKNPLNTGHLNMFLGPVSHLI